MDIRGINKRGQETMSMPFGVIFSIFLIVIFFVVAFVAIRYFLSIQDMSKVGIFYRDFQGAINDALSTESSDDVFKIDLPSKIKKVCFGNLSAKITNLDDYEQVKDYDIYQANVFLIPTTEAGNMPWKIINHLNITKITEKQNPYCIFVSREIKIKKEFYDRLVRVE